MEDLRLSPLRLGSFKSSPPRGSPTFRRVHSGRTPRREVKANGGALQWFRINELIRLLI
ncbi:BnaC05g37400D [Brassica napus]|uniref:BnaC05g37400D protein n=1 Tax=Brassica napus TaxID=3708 RepID=A0A078GY34_BRANA|nr:BnaC05g37400D [Brassica napus]